MGKRMTKAEWRERSLLKARSFADQGRFAEARLQYEIIIADLTRKPRPGKAA